MPVMCFVPGQHEQLIPAGTFTMGAIDSYPDEQPIRTVRISRPFYLGKYEVTQAQWEAVMGYNPSSWRGQPWLPSPREPSRRCRVPCAQDRAIRCDLGYTVRSVHMTKFLGDDNARVSACLVMHHLADNASRHTYKT